MEIRCISDRQIILAALKKVKPSLIIKYGVKDLALFGSYSRNTAIDGQSDVDLLVDFSQPIGFGFIALADELEELLQLKVHLVSRNAIKPKDFIVIEPDLIFV